MKKLNRKIILICMIILSLCVVSGCKKKTEIAITDDGEDVTVAEKQYDKLSESKEPKFSYNDLTIDDLKYMMTEDEVKNIKGNPDSIYSTDQKQISDDIQKDDEKVYIYGELTLGFSKIDGKYLLTTAASTGNNVFSRNIKVGDTFNDLLNKYYRDSNCMNNGYYTEDKSVMIGKMLYGNFCLEDLERVKTKDAVQYGIINFNGYSSLDVADSYIVEYTCFEKPYKNNIASMDDDFAQLSFEIDRNGKITAIRWFFYPEQ